LHLTVAAGNYCVKPFEKHNNLARQQQQIQIEIITDRNMKVKASMLGKS